jgi:ribulose-5-phosphate 4-epimerase/fuculose-1-phosphate aldolase
MTTGTHTLPSQSIQQRRIDLAAAHRLAVMDDLHEGTWNHLSLDTGVGDGSFLLSPPATHWSQVRASNLIEVGPKDRDEIEARGDMRWVAYRIHAPIHWGHADARAVLHVHSPQVLALSMLDDPRLEPGEQNALSLISRTAYTDAYDGSVPQDIRHGEFLSEALGEKSVLILRNHGAVVVGKTIAQAYTDLYVLDRAARAMILALSTGRPLRDVPSEVVGQFAAATEDEQYPHDHFEAMKAVLDANQPDYRD